MSTQRPAPHPIAALAIGMAAILALADLAGCAPSLLPGTRECVGFPAEVCQSHIKSGDVAGVWTSPDGRTWEPAKVTQPAGTMSAVASGQGRLVAVGTAFAGTSGPAAWTSVDGRTWQALPASAFAASAGHEPGALEDIAAGPGGFVVVGSEVGAGGRRATAWYSTDGLAWTRTESDLGGDSAGAVVQFGSGYVAAGWVARRGRR